MEIEPVARRFSPIPAQRTGATAELAEARAQLRELAPSDRLDDVLAEVRRLQARDGLTPLAAVQAVLAKLAAGWRPG
jgi:pyruvate/oxaloacetate carboxyltransferase